MKKIAQDNLKVVLGASAASLLIGSLGNGIFWYLKTAEIQTAENEHIAFIENADKLIKQAKEVRAEKERVRQAAAKELAARAAQGDASAEGIDSKVCNPDTRNNDPTSSTVVVNKKHCLQPVSYEPADLVTLHGATLSKKAVDAFNRMYSDATAAGQSFTVTSSYRSYADQVATYGHWVNTSGQEAADTYSARPGYSEHQTGFVIDVAAPGCMLDCFGSTSQYHWLQGNAAKYGFIQRYYKGYEAITGYKAEEWHYRYVGEKVATDMKTKGIKTLEEYFNVTGGGY